MQFLSTTVQFLVRNRRQIGFLIGAGVGALGIYKYVDSTSERFESGATGEFIGRRNRTIEEVLEESTRRYRVTAVNICKKIEQLLNERFSSTQVLNELNSCTDINRKIELFNQLKLTIFNRILSDFYSFSLFTGLWKIQISIVSAYVYLDIRNRTNLMETSMQLEFLELCSYFCNQGIYQLLDVITQSVEETFRDIHLDDEVDFTRILLLFARCQDSIKNLIFNNESFIRDYLFEQTPTEARTALFNRISEDLYEYLNTDDFKKCLEDSFVQGFIIIKDRILSKCLNNENIRLALLLPRIKKLMEGYSGPNQTVHFLMEVQSLRAFSENICESIISS